ncbi:MAG: HNH endonuclease [Cellulomonas sp.]|nr:HNH endonuclease [Cellulomonas sp.]
MVNRPKAITPCACGCGQHPRRWDARYVAGHRPPRPLADRLWSRVTKTEAGCWEWQGFRGPTGHGQIGRGSRRDGLVATHRAAWEVTYGPIPDGMIVRHRCDNPPCCNPEHLELGTQTQNVGDMVARARQARGRALPQTRLSDEQVSEIRAAVADGERQRAIAARFGITQGHVSALASRTYRKDVA